MNSESPSGGDVCLPRTPSTLARLLFPRFISLLIAVRRLPLDELPPKFEFWLGYLNDLGRASLNLLTTFARASNSKSNRCIAELKRRGEPNAKSMRPDTAGTGPSRAWRLLKAVLRAGRSPDPEPHEDES